MKQKRKWLSAFFAIVFLVMLSGCSAVFSGIESYEKDQTVFFVAFSNENEKLDPFDYSEIDGYESELSLYNSRVLYNTLSEDEKRVYRFYEYALDHGYTSVFMDSRLTANLQVTPTQILSFFTMDSAFVPQSYEYSESETEYTFSYLYGLLDFDVEGVEVTTELFEEKALEKRKEALSAAKAVVQSMPAELSDLEKARYFYRYLTSEVEYQLYEEGETPNYLHDAFYRKKTQCDGFANAFSLLCALENIPCFEKIYDAQENKEAGHTWNSFYAEGNWYNADCAISGDLCLAQENYGVDFYFGFSDERQEEIPVFSSRLPSCTEDLVPVDLVVSSSSDPAMRAQIGRAFSSSGAGGILIRIEKGTFGDDDLQKIANFLQADLYSIPMVWGGVNHLYLFRTE